MYKLVTLLAKLSAASVLAAEGAILLGIALFTPLQFWDCSFCVEMALLLLAAFHAPRPTKSAPIAIVEPIVLSADEEFSDASAP